MSIIGSANFFVGRSSRSQYKIERSLRFNSADSANCSRTFLASGSLTTWTWSAWVKRSSFGGYQLLFGTGDNNSSSNQTSINFSLDALDFYNVNGGYKTSSALFRDPSAWYHVVAAWDTANGTAADRMRIYVNGARITAFSSSSDPSSSTSSVVNSAVSHSIGTLPTNSGNYFNGLLTEINFIDGQALTPSSFGETDPATGVWRPKKYTGTYGTNGFYLKFADNSGTTSTTLGKDSSGNGNNWTPNNFSVTAGAGDDSMIDTPTPYADGGNGRGNYCTWSPIYTIPGNTTTSFTNGNLDFSVTQAEGTGEASAVTTMPLPTTGKWYWEITPTTVATLAASRTQVGVMGRAQINRVMGNNADCFAYTAAGGSISKVTAAAFTSYGNSYTANDVISVAVDLDNGAIYFAKNGTWQNSGVPTSGASKTGAAFTTLAGTNEYFPAVGYWGTFVANFGQRPFAYTPPSGFLALNTQNLPEPSIKKPSSYFNTVLFTGNTSTAGVTQAITGVGFAPDFVWVKTRNQAFNHFLYDAVRGVGSSGKLLQSNNTNAESTNGEMDSLDADGFTVKYTGTNTLNWSSSNNVAWCWDESATPGFDIVTFTAQATASTVAHSLGVAPKFIIMKDRDTAAYNWFIYHADVGIQKYLMFTTAASTSNSTVFSTAPTSTVFDPGTGVTTGNGFNKNVAYLWSEVAGFSKFGTYNSNASSDGPYIHCGFRPKVIWIKKTSGSTNANSGWCIFDATRSTYNVAGVSLRADLSDAELSFNAVDFTSSGFKLRVVSIEVNSSVSGDSYIFCAWAETPAKYALAR